MKNLKKNTAKAFSLIELLIVIAIIGILAGATLPALSSARQSGLRAKDANNIKQIILGLRTFSADYEGIFPSYDPDEEAGEESTFSTSTDAFNVVIPDYIDTEAVFWFATKHPEKLRAPTEDGTLESRECVYGYATAQTDSSYSLSPLVFDGLMDSPGAMSEHHPWLDKKKAVIGYVDGHVEQNRLTGGGAGATVKSNDNRVDNIFEERETDSEGQSTGGYLATSQENVLLPD